MSVQLTEVMTRETKTLMSRDTATNKLVSSDRRNRTQLLLPRSFNTLKDHRTMIEREVGIIEGNEFNTIIGRL